jgi:hypothetical protein
LRQRTGNLGEIVQVEQALADVRLEIETLQSNQKRIDNDVQFATIQLEVDEEYRAEVQTNLPSVGTRLRNGVVDGYDTALESVIEATLFALGYGPTLLLWSGVVLAGVFGFRRVRAYRSGK